jgi:VCBS repeat-containing protein
VHCGNGFDAVDLTIGYDVTDGTATTHGTGTLTVNGTNDAPQIASADQAVVITDSEALGATGSSAIHHLSGPLHFSDADLSDRPGGATTGFNAVYTDAHGVSQPLSVAQTAAFGAAFTLAAAAGNTNSGQLNWDYSLADGALDFLGLGETLTVTLAVNVNDQHGGAAPANVTLAFSGQNDAPVVSAITSVPTTDRSASVTVNLLSTASDPHIHDTLNVVPGSGVLTSSDGHAVSGTVTGNLLTINPAQFQYLGAGQSVTLTYGFNITDGTAVVADTGSLLVSHAANHAPTISAINAGTSTQNDAIKQINLLTGAADADVSDALSVVSSSLVLTAADHHTVVGTLASGVLSIDPSQFNYLHAGQSDTITAAYSITDGTAVVANTASWTVTGLNDAPVVPTTDLKTTTQSYSISFYALTGVTNPDGVSNTLVAGSALAASSDGHAVSVTSGGTYINLDASQFKYLADGQTAKVTIGFDIASTLTGAPTTHGTAMVTVVGTNDAPVAPSAVTVSMADTSAYDIFQIQTATVATTDPDAGTVLGYSGYFGSLASPGNGTTYGYYAVNALGEYTYFADSAKINALKTGTVSDTVGVVASDRSGGTANINTVMSFTAADDTPHNVTWSVGGSVIEHTVNAFDLGTLKAVDPDTSDTATWSLVDSAGGRFASSTGHVTVANSTLLDYATTPAGYDIVVKDTDATGLYVQQTVHVSLVQMPTGTLSGTSGADTLTGTAGNDVILGLAGNDTISAGAGDDLVLPGLGANNSDGGTGNTTISYIDSTSAITANLTTGVVIRSGYSNDTATNFQNIVGTPYDDTITGTTGNNAIQGGAGNDQIYGMGGNDAIDGGTGFNTVHFDSFTSAIMANLQTQTLGGSGWWRMATASPSTFPPARSACWWMRPS